MDQIKIGQFIAELRKEQKMTQLDLATKIGVTDRAISKWENGRGLPDMSLITPLCETLQISIDELLKGERIENSQKLAAAHENLINILNERERERRKGKIRLLISVLLTVAIFLSVMLTPMLFASCRGDGYSFSAAYATRLAKSVSKSILKGNYSKAVKAIGFENADNRAPAQKEWILAMENLSDQNLSVTQFTVWRMIENDRFVSGYSTMIVYDYISNKKYVFDFQIAFQDKGISFMESYTANLTNQREKEVLTIINNALCTYYAG